jgi:hypothetical protein
VASETKLHRAGAENFLLVCGSVKILAPPPA